MAQGPLVLLKTIGERRTADDDPDTLAKIKKALRVKVSLSEMLD